MKNIIHFFKTLFSLPKVLLKAMEARIEYLNKERENRIKCIELLQRLPMEKDFDIVLARESLIQGDYMEALGCLINYINKNNK